MDCRLAGNWLRATALASLLMLSACGSQDSSFSIDLHGSPNDVLGAIDEPALNQVTSYIPEAQINRSRPSDSEVLYTMPGEKPGAEITIKFTLTPLASGEGTKLETALHIPDVSMNIGGVKKVLGRKLIEREMRRNLEYLADRLDSGQSTLGSRKDMGALMAALAIANHPSALARLSSASGSRELESRLLDGMRYWSGGGYGIPGMGQSPNPTRITPNIVIPDSIPRGTDPSPLINGGAAARPMLRPTGTNPNAYY